MILLLTPSVEDMLAIQEAENHYYWSAAAETLFRAEGWVSVQTSHGAPVPEGCGIVAARGTKPELLRGTDPTFRFFEGPLAPEVAAAFRVKVESLSVTRSLDVRWGNYDAITLHYSEEQYVCPETGALTKAAAPKWVAPGIVGQSFVDIEGWSVHLWLVDPATSEPKPVLISKDSVFLCGLPLLDLAVRENAFPPIPGPYDRRDTTTGSNHIVRLLIDLLALEHRKRLDGAPILKLRRWPKGFDAAFTVRHDYDRRIPIGSIDELLNLYDGLRLKCSIGFLSYLSPERDVRAFMERGHEVQLHSHGADQASFERTLVILRHRAGGDIRGATIHGGSTSLGFMGDTFYGWAEEAGLDYVEGFFNTTNAPVAPIIRIGPAGVPVASKLLGSRAHVSLDTGTEPGASQLKEVLLALPSMLGAGDHVILMNHPDLNRADFTHALQTVDLKGVWCATQAEVADWFRATHFESSVATADDSVRLEFPRELDVDAVVRLIWAGEETEVVLSNIRQAHFARTGGAIRQVDRQGAMVSRSRHGTSAVQPSPSLGREALSSELDSQLPELYEPGRPSAHPPANIPPYDASFFKGRSIEPVPAVQAHQNSGLRALLGLLGLRRGGRALDVSQHGASASAGDATTVPLLEHLGTSLDVLDADAAACGALRERFARRATIHHADFFGFEAPKAYDLIVIDLSVAQMALNFNAILHRAYSLLVPAGKLVMTFIYDLDAVYAGESPLVNPASRDVQEMLLFDLVSSNRLRIEDFRRALWPRGFGLLGWVDKWMGRGRAQGIGWLCLEKLGPDV